MKQEDLDDLKQIELIRRRNNINWMEILRIAMENDPVATKAVLKGVLICDLNISKITDRLANS